MPVDRTTSSQTPQTPLDAPDASNAPTQGPETGSGETKQTLTNDKLLTQQEFAITVSIPADVSIIDDHFPAPEQEDADWDFIQKNDYSNGENNSYFQTALLHKPALAT